MAEMAPDLLWTLLNHNMRKVSLLKITPFEHVWWSQQESRIKLIYQNRLETTSKSIKTEGEL